MPRPLFVISALVLGATAATAQPLFPLTPDWTSSDTQVSTGGALADLDRDGWLDFVVANGNDIYQQKLVVYYNNGDGTLPLLPNWYSSDNRYNGHLDVADVNADGWLDVAVATLGAGDTGQGPVARLYLNNNGTLGATPAWSANIVGNAFGCAFGDMNNDGRPDLAVATGWAYSPPNSFPQVVYLNSGGTLAASPSWTSADIHHAQGVCWVDADGDGWLDLATANSGTRNRIYRNLGGVLETTASWFATDVNAPDAIMVAAGDVNGDGAPELLIADNNQIAGGSGRIRQYNGVPGGMPSPTAAWTYYDGYCSAVALADVNSDGLLDLATGAWWDYSRVFLNAGAGFGTTHSWRSTGSSVIEKLVFGDIDKDGLRPTHAEFAPLPGRRLYQLPHRQIHEVVAVTADGVALAASQYFVSREHGWLTVGVDPAVEVRVDYTVSSKLDLGVTNWDSDVGNFVYYNQLVVLGDVDCSGALGFADINPFVMLLTGAYEENFPDCDGQTYGDMNQDGAVDFGDINPFVAALSGGG